MKKKNLALFLALTMVAASFVGCGDKKASDNGSAKHEAFCQVLFRVIDATYALFSTIKPHAVIHGAVGLWLKWRSGKVARYLGFATWILPVHFFRA